VNTDWGVGEGSGGKTGMSTLGNLRAPGDLVKSRERIALRASPAIARSYWWVPIVRINVLLVADLFALFAAAALGFYAYAGPVLHQQTYLYTPTVGLLFFVPLGFAAAGLYPGFGLGSVDTLRRMLLTTGFAGLVFAGLIFLLKMPPIYSRVTYAIAFASALFLLPLVRFATVSLTSRWRWWNRPVVLVGTLHAVEAMVRALRDSPGLGYRPVAVLVTDSRLGGDRKLHDLPAIQSPQALATLGESSECEALVDESCATSVLPQLLQDHFRKVTMTRELGAELPVQGACLRILGDLLGVQFSNKLLVKRNRIVKRAIDIFFGAFLSVCALPFIAMGAFGVWAMSGRPLFYSQERRGLDGKTIKVWKLRTMCLNAEVALDDYLQSHPQMVRRWNESFKLDNDPRIIPVIGNFLRRHSLDELPQLFSVVAGEMSLVGPRPFPDYHLAKVSPESRTLRHRVRPGVTGLWQVAVRSSGDLDAQSHYDVFYVRNWSIWLDLYILARTVGAVLTGKGAS
jgi:Undecaprenyl-phosphate galactose phosphotransferase WbaP